MLISTFLHNKILILNRKSSLCKNCENKFKIIKDSKPYKITAEQPQWNRNGKQSKGLNNNNFIVFFYLFVIRETKL